MSDEKHTWLELLSEVSQMARAHPETIEGQIRVLTNHVLEGHKRQDENLMGMGVIGLLALWLEEFGKH